MTSPQSPSTLRQFLSDWSIWLVLIVFFLGISGMMANFTILETKYWQGADQAAATITQNLSGERLQSAAALVMDDSAPCVRAGLHEIEYGFPIVAIFSRRDRQHSFEKGRENALSCYRERLAATHTLSQSQDWMALMAAQ